MSLDNTTKPISETETVKRKRTWLRFLLLLFLGPIFGLSLVVLGAWLSHNGSRIVHTHAGDRGIKFDILPLALNFNTNSTTPIYRAGTSVGTPVELSAGSASRRIAYLMTRIEPLHLTGQHDQYELKNINVIGNDNDNVVLEYVGSDDWTGLDLVTCQSKTYAYSLSSVMQPCVPGDEVDTAIIKQGDGKGHYLKNIEWKPSTVKVIGLHGIRRHDDGRSGDTPDIPYLMLNMKLRYGTPLYKGRALVGIVIGSSPTTVSDDNLGSLALPAALIEGAIGTILHDPRWTTERRRRDIERYRASIADSTLPSPSQFDQKSSTAEATGTDRQPEGVITDDGRPSDSTSVVDATNPSSSDSQPRADSQTALNVSPTEKDRSRGQAGFKRIRSEPTQAEGDLQDAAFEREARELAVRLRSAKPEELPSLRHRLEAHNDRHFEYRQQQRMQEIERLSSRVDSLRLLRLRRQENKAKILERRMNDLLGTASDSDWNGAGVGDETVKQPATLTTTVGLTGAIPKKAAATTTNDDPTEPTFKGIPVSQWLKRLVTERDRDNLAQAIEAMLQLAADVNPGDLARAIFRMSRGLNMTQDLFGNPTHIISGSDTLLCLLKSDIVSYVLAAELDGKKGVPRNGFKVLVADWLDLLAKYPNPSKEQRKITPIPETHHVSKESVASARREIRHRSRQLINKLVEWSRRDESLNDWVVECSQSILEICEQPLTTYPGLIPIAEKVFADTQSPMCLAAANVLSRSEQHADQIISFAEPLLTSDANNVDDSNRKSMLLSCFVCLSKHTPKSVQRLSEELGRRWGQIENPPAFNFADPVQEYVQSFVFLLYALAEIGEPAREIIPFLQRAAQSSSAQRETNWPLRMRLPIYFPLNSVAEHKLQDHILDTIKQIEEAKPKSKRESLPDDEPKQFEEANAIRDNPDPGIANELIEPNTKAPAGTIATTEEPTFDGVPYSQWMKMLETERKPERLATAIEACGRLARPKDEHEIIRLILIAARLAETAGFDDQKEVWKSGWKALQRLTGDAIVDELISPNNEDVSYRSGREFQALLVEHHASESFKESLKKRANEVIIQLLERLKNPETPDEWLLAMASSVWLYSNRPLDDFEGLKPVLLKVFESGPGIGRDIPYKHNAWQIVVANLVEGAPEIPDLALMIFRHAKGYHDYLRIMELGKNAEPVVPLLVDRFLKVWNAYEALGFPEKPDDSMKNGLETCSLIIQTLAKIDGGEKGIALLRQLELTSLGLGWKQAIPNDIAHDLWRWVKSPRVIPPALERTALLNDRTLINGRWKIRDVAPYKKPKALVRINRVKFDIEERDVFSRQVTLVRNIGPFPILDQFDIDSTKQPKEINLRLSDEVAKLTTDDEEEPAKRQLGVYELTETSLRIQLAKIGEPRPTELVSDKSQLPKGQLLLELERSFEEIVQEAKSNE
jgi:hypothetical protein